MATEEYDLAQRVLRQDAGAAEAFVERFKEPLRAYLFSKCHGPHERDLAEFHIDGLLAKCCATDFLGKYGGDGSLEGWLKVVAKRDFLAELEKRSRDPARESVQAIKERTGVDSVEPAGTADGDLSQFEFLGGIDPRHFHETLLEATVHAFKRLREERPDCLAILRLSLLYAVKQKMIAAAFGIGEPEVSRKKRDGFEFLQSEVNSYLFSHFPRSCFTFEDLREFARIFEKLVLDEDLGDSLRDQFSK